MQLARHHDHMVHVVDAVDEAADRRQYGVLGVVEARLVVQRDGGDLARNADLLDFRQVQG